MSGRRIWKTEFYANASVDPDILCIYLNGGPEYHEVLRMCWAKLLRRPGAHVGFGNFRRAFPFEIVRHRRLREDRVAHDSEKFLVRRMVAQVDGPLAELRPRERAQVLQALENDEIAIES